MSKRVPLNMRSTQELRDKLAKAAAESGRSLVGEVEHRLEKSFWEEDIIRRIGSANGYRWADLNTYNIRYSDHGRHDEDMRCAIDAAMNADK